jgi:hypothetical protein
VGSIIRFRVRPEIPAVCRSVDRSRQSNRRKLEDL